MRPACPVALSLLFSLLGLSTSCSERSDLELFVDLKSDYVGRAEVDSVRVVLLGGDSAEVVASVDTRVVLQDLTQGMRIAELSDLTPGQYRVKVQLSGDVVVPERVIRVEMEDSFAVTVVITRDCADVVCPASEAALTQCLGGVCVDPACTPETPEHCPTPECASDADCADTGIACAPAACVAGVCTAAPSSQTCLIGEYCEPTMGCIAQSCTVDDDCDRCARCTAGSCSPLSFATIAAGHQSVCAIDELGERWCWGNSPDRVLGLGDARGADFQPIPRHADDGGSWSLLALGYAGFAGSGIRSDGTLWFWGGDEQDPVQVGMDTTWMAISAANSRKLALQANGSLWEDGDPVGTDTDWARATAGWSHACAVKVDGRLFCWGDNTYGQLGTGDTDPRDQPTQIGSDTDWVSASGGEQTSCGIKTDGRLFCWGSGYEPTPTQVGTDTNWSFFLFEWYHGCGLKTDGSIACLGGDENGELGVGAVDDSSDVPRPITKAGPWSQLTVGGHFNCAFHDTEMRWYCWGADFGIGTGTGTDAPDPVPLCPGP